jgi:hypothetical protein
MGKVVPTQQVIETKNGEVMVTINLNLTITLDDSGRLSVISNATLPKKEEKVAFEMPVLSENTGELIPDFGK